jgi:hypothetical protein
MHAKANTVQSDFVNPRDRGSRLHAVACRKSYGKSSALAFAVGSDVKDKLSLAIYVVSVPLAFVNPWISISLYVVVAAMWLGPTGASRRGRSRGHLKRAEFLFARLGKS